MEQAQLERIAEKAGQTGKKVLWIGSAGLAQGLLQIQQRELPAMAVIGSISSKTMEQLAYCRNQGTGHEGPL
mgnify:FL=1